MTLFSGGLRVTTRPEGFTPHERKSPVTDAWAPLYSRRSGACVEIALIVASAHCNPKGLLHGGVIATLADKAMGLSLGASLIASDDRFG